MKYHYTPIRRAKVIKTDNAETWKRCGETRSFLYCLSESNTVHNPEVISAIS